MEELDEVQIHPNYPNHKVQIGARLEPELREKLISFLVQQHDYFAWSHADMTGIDPEVVVHRPKLSTSQVEEKKIHHQKEQRNQ